MHPISPARSTFLTIGVISFLLVCVLGHSAAQPAAGRAAALTVGGIPTVTPTCGPPGFTPWTAAAAVPIPARLISVASDGSAAYAVGGLASAGYLSDTHRYDPPTDTWTALPPLPLPVAGASVVYAPNTGKLYVFGGESDGVTISTATQIYDPSSQSWTSGAPLPAPRAAMTAGYWNGHIYLAAGTNTVRFTPQFQMWDYNPFTDSWTTTLPTLPRDTMGAAGGVLNGRMLIAGGANNAAQPLSAIQFYDLATHERGYLPDLPLAVYGAGGAVVNGQLWVFGGGQPFVAASAEPRLDAAVPNALMVSEIYDPATNGWQAGPPLQTSRVLLGSTVVGNRVLAIGGLGDNGDLSSVEGADSVPHPPCPTITPTPTLTGTPPTATATPSPTATLCGNWGSIDPWAIISTLPPPLYGTTLSSDGQYLYEAGGGSDSYHNGTRQMARYDPATGLWQPRTMLPGLSVYASMAYAPNVQKFYYFGGSDGTLANSHMVPDRVTNNTVVYDPRIDQWANAANMPSSLGRAFFTAAYGDGKIYVPGGSFSTGFSPQNTLWAYDPPTDSWDSSLPPLPIPVLAAGSGVINGHLYVAGGSQHSDNVLQTLFDYDIAARTWYTRTPMLTGAAFGESAVVGGRLWVMGGGTPYRGAAAPAVVNTVQIYDPVSDSWSWGPPLTGGRRLGGAAALGNQMFLYGGQDNGYNPVDSLEMTRFHPGLLCPSATTTETPPPTATPTPTGPPRLTATLTATGSANPTRSATVTPVPTITELPHTDTPTRTGIPAPATPTPTITGTPCTIRFSDVSDPTAYYYGGVYALACRGVISGYSDGRFLPFNLTTRAQMTKIVTLAFGLAAATPAVGGTFADVLPNNVFYGLVETAVAHGLVSGYRCGGSNPQTGSAEPCDSARRPYFRPANSVTRGQLTKIVVLGAGWALQPPTQPSFNDVGTGNVFYPFVETAMQHQVVSGYSDGTFRPAANAFRGQIAKIVALAIQPAVQGGSPVAVALH